VGATTTIWVEEKPMELVITTREVGDRTVVSVVGEVDIASAGALDAVLSEAIASGRTHLVVDLEEVGFLDSTGLGVLVKSLKRTREAGGSLTVVTESERVLKVIRITGLDAVIPLFASVDLALAAVPE